VSSSRDKDLLGRTVSGVRWNGAAHILKQGLQFLISIILIRLLTPEVYGLLGMAAVFVGFVGVFSDLGFSQALVQRPTLSEEHRCTAFWLGIGLGLGLGGLLAALAGPIAGFYGQPELTGVLRVLAVAFVLTALGAVPKALLQRDLAFKGIARVEVPALVVAGAVGIGLAVNGAGVWSLVGQQLVFPATQAALLWWVVDWRPRLRISPPAARDLWTFGGGLTGFGIVNYWARRGDDLLIGRFMGAASLGLYGRAYGLMLLPIRHVISAVNRVIFSALSSIQDDRARVRRAYLKAIRLISFLAFPMMAGLAVTARPFVLAVFGQRWTGVIPLIQILSLAGIVQTLMNPTGLIYTSQGRTDVMMKWGLGAGAFLIGALAVGVWIGSLKAVVWSYTVANVVLLWPGQSIPGRLIGMTFADVAQSVSGLSAATGCMAVLVFAVGRWVVPPDWSPWSSLVVLTATGVLAYAGLARTLAEPAWREFWRVTGEVLGVSGDRSSSGADPVAVP